MHCNVFEVKVTLYFEQNRVKHMHKLFDVTKQVYVLLVFENILYQWQTKFASITPTILC